MFELWILVDNYDYFKVMESDSLHQIRGLEYEYALQGGISEVRIKDGAL